MNTKNQKGFLSLIPAIVIGLVAIGGGVVATSQNAIPGNVLYGLKNATEKIRTVLSFTHSEKAKTHLSITLEKLEEIERLRSQKDPAQHISAAAESLKKHQDAAIEEFNQLNSKNQNSSDIINKLQINSEQQQIVLVDLLNKVPEAAKQGIQNAIDSSIKGLQKAQEVHNK